MNTSNNILVMLVAIAAVLAFALIGCNSSSPTGTGGGHQGGGGHGDGGHGGEGHEEGGWQGLGETYNEVHQGVHLILSYNSQSNAFVGTMENIAIHTITRVRVEVHLNNGTELGPTPAVDLDPGETRNINLPAGTTDFDLWYTHLEVG